MIRPVFDLVKADVSRIGPLTGRGEKPGELHLIQKPLHLLVMRVHSFESEMDVA
jgi:hypothetical protein